MKNVIKFIALIGWPFVVLIGVNIWSERKAEEREKRIRREILSDTAAVNQAHRTYERIHRQQLMEDSEYVRLYEENQGLKERINND